MRQCGSAFRVDQCTKLNLTHARRRLHSYITACVTCKKQVSELVYDKHVNQQFTGVTSSKRGKKTGALKLWWNGEETAHPIPKEASFVYPNLVEEGWVESPLTIGVNKTRELAMMNIQSLHVNTDEGPAPPPDWSGFYKFTRSGDKYELLDGYLILAQVGEECPEYFPETSCENNLPYAFLKTPGADAVTGDATITFGSGNFYPSPTTGRIHLILDETLYIPVLTPSATVKLTNLAPGLHNITIQMFLRR